MFAVQACGVDVVGDFVVAVLVVDVAAVAVVVEMVVVVVVVVFDASTENLASKKIAD